MFDEYMQYVAAELQVVMQHAITFIPRLLVSIVLLLVTKLAAVVVRSVSVKILRVMGINVIARKLGVETFLKSVSSNGNLSGLLGAVFYWLLMFIGFTYSLRYLGFQPAEMLLTAIVFYMPRIAAALVILLLGIYLAGLLGSRVERSMAAINGKYALLAGGAVKSGLVFLTILTILDELGVNLEYIRVGIYLTAGAAATILVFMFGMGSIQSGRDIVAGVWLRTYLTEGTHIVLENETWQIERILGTVVRLRQGSKVRFVPNADFATGCTIQDGNEGDAAV